MNDSQTALVKKLVGDMYRDGYSVQYMGPEIVLDNAPYAYTCGRALFDKPELLISGPFDKEELHDILDAATEILDPKLIAFLVDPNGNLTFGRVEVRDRTFEVRPCSPAPCHSCAAVFGPGRFTVLQLVWSDPNGRYPGDPDYDIPSTVQTIYGE